MCYEAMIYYLFTLVLSLKESLESTEKLLEPFPAVVSTNKL